MEPRDEREPVRTTDFTGYKTEFLRLFGFEIAGVDYDADVNPDVKIPGIIDTTV